MTLDVFTLERRQQFKDLVIEYFDYRSDQAFAKEIAFIIHSFKD